MSSHGSSVIEHKHPSDFEGARMGMWIFLFTEVLLFGGLFIAYAVNRSVYPIDFMNASLNLNLTIGLINTIFLLTSSLTVVLAIVAFQKGRLKFAEWMIWTTLLFAVGFLVNKAFEYGAKIHHGIYPGSPDLVADHTPGEVVFYNLYYAMTGLHVIHVIIGSVVFLVVLYFMKRRPVNKEVIPFDMLKEFRGGSKLAVISEDGKVLGEVGNIDNQTELVDIRFKYEKVLEKMDPKNILKLENAGLYWHIVDIIWIFLFPLFYLIG